MPTNTHPSREDLPDTTPPDLVTQEGERRADVHVLDDGLLVISPPFDVQMATKAIPDAELYRLVRWLALDFDEGRHHDNLRAMLAALPVALVQDTRAEMAELRAASQAREEEQRAERERRRLDVEREAGEREESNQRSLMLWADFLESRREEIAALRAAPAPVELPQVAERWLAVKGAEGVPCVLGTGRTIDEAHRAFIEERLSWISNPEIAADAFGEPGEPLSELAPLPTAYLRLSGPEALVDALASALRDMVV